MPRGRKSGKAQAGDEAMLTKGQVRKLNALRRSIGDKLGERAFAEWLKTARAAHEVGADADPNIERIRGALNEIRDTLKFKRGGAYLVRQGRGRLIVEPAEVEK